MLDFMENVQNAFYEASHWNTDNSYGTLNATARGRSHFPFHRVSTLTVDCSIARLPDTKGSKTADIVPCCAKLCDILHAWERRRRRWLGVLPVFIVAATEEAEEFRA